MPKPYRLSPGRRLINLVVRPLARVGLTGPRTHLLTVPGRKTGKPWSTPISLIEWDGKRYAVAPYGDRNWVRNARAAGWVELRRGRRHERCEVVELEPEAAVPVLREYYRRSTLTHSFFDVDLHSSFECWVQDAPRHPVFRLEPDE
jgi:deazaflavin-dependent oxidoreductase (nitroreductase family)